MSKYAPIRSGNLTDEFKNCFISRLGETAKDLGFNYKYICEENDGNKKYYFIVYIDLYEKWVKYYKEISEIYLTNKRLKPCGIYSIELEFERQIYCIDTALMNMSYMEIAYNLYKFTDFNIPEYVDISVISEYTTAIDKKTTLEVNRISYDFLKKLLLLNSLNPNEAKKYSKQISKDAAEAKKLAKLAGVYDPNTDTKGKKILGQKSNSPNNIPLRKLQKYGETFKIDPTQEIYKNLRTLLESSNILFNMDDPYVYRDERIVLDFDPNYNSNDLYEERVKFTFLEKDRIQVYKLLNAASFTNKYLSINEKNASDFDSYIKLSINYNFFDDFFAKLKEIGIDFYYDYSDIEKIGKCISIDIIPIIIDGKYIEKLNFLFDKEFDYENYTKYIPSRLFDIDQKLKSIALNNKNKTYNASNKIRYFLSW